ncbi:MAG: ergosterol biosynthesis protein [Icmadophila ericetorum]|nr:ergosterol biosynthesis protein [Icmadophila ericetorum]
MDYILPAYDGFLPYWLLFIAIVSVFNTVQCYVTTSLTRRVYAGPASSQVTPLSARTFGTWTLLSSVIRFYAAYRIDDNDFYSLALWTYVIALAHFGSELLVYKTAKLNQGISPTLVVAVSSLLWMLVQREYYVKT